MKRILIFALLSLALPVMLTGCGADAQLGKMTLASQLDTQGQSLADTTTFTPGDTVYLSVELLGAYEGLQSSVTWRRGDEILATEELVTPRSVDSLNPLFITSKLETTADWQADTYQCDVFVPDQGTTTLEFTISQEEK